MDHLELLFMIVAGLLILSLALAIGLSLWRFNRMHGPSSNEELRRLNTYYNGLTFPQLQSNSLRSRKRGSVFSWWQPQMKKLLRNVTALW